MLAENKRGLEAYLQFDSLEREALIHLRGADLRAISARRSHDYEAGLGGLAGGNRRHLPDPGRDPRSPGLRALPEPATGDEIHPV
jgi:hypothetical protein